MTCYETMSTCLIIKTASNCVLHGISFRLVHNLPPEAKVEMDNMECFTKQTPPEFKLIKHLLRLGDADAPDQ